MAATVVVPIFLLGPPTRAAGRGAGRTRRRRAAPPLLCDADSTVGVTRAAARENMQVGACVKNGRPAVLLPGGMHASRLVPFGSC
jgi:hypothetical protein